MRIGVDIDNVINNLSPLLEKSVKEHFGNGWTLWDIYQRYHLRDALRLSVWEELWFWKKYGLEIASQSKPQPYCREALHWLRRNGCRIYLITARPAIMKPMTLAWLEQHQVPYDKVIFGASEKGKICRENGIAVMVEDSDKNIQNLLENGVTTIAIPYPYNSHFRSQNLIYLADWRAIANLIMQMRPKL